MNEGFIHQYLTLSGLHDPPTAVHFSLLEKYLTSFESELARAKSHLERQPIENLDEKLFRYQVPKPAEDGSCANFEDLADEPYDVEPVLKGSRVDKLRYLSLLNLLLDHVYAHAQPDWTGVYKTVDAHSPDARLVKLVYRGIPSRGEFPLTEESMRVSNNSKVGLTGGAVIIQDVRAHVERGGAYYACDARVQSELCLPVFSPDFDRVVGIIDIETLERQYFDNRKVALFVAFAVALSGVLSDGGN